MISNILANVTLPDNYYLDQTWTTIWMVGLTIFFSYLIGIPLGVILNVTDKHGLYENKIVYRILDVIINILRAAPFIILMVFLLPYIRNVIGTGTGNVPFVICLVITAIPFIARLIESSLKEVDYGVIEASLAMGASKLRIIFKVLIPEAKSSIIVGFTIAFATILGYTAMAGTIGADGLGKAAYSYGYVRNQRDVLYVSLVILIVLVVIVQYLGMFIARILDHRKKGE